MVGLMGLGWAEERRGALFIEQAVREMLYVNRFTMYNCSVKSVLNIWGSTGSFSNLPRLLNPGMECFLPQDPAALGTHYCEARYRKSQGSVKLNGSLRFE